MIAIEYIIDNDKSLLTILINNNVLNHLKAKVDDYVNFYQSSHDRNRFTLFKADTGYRIIRTKNKKKFYQIQVRHKINDIKEFDMRECTYFLKKNRTIKVFVKI